MPRSQTPVVSCALAIPPPGLLPAGACQPSALTAIPLRLSCWPRLYLLRGAITRPASSLTPASSAHCWAGTWSSLLTCWLGVRQGGLEPEGSHPRGNNNQFHRISPTPKVSGLPWREQAGVRPGMRYCKACPHSYWRGSSTARGSARAHTERHGRWRSALRAPAPVARRAPARARSRGPHTPRPSPQP